MGRGGDSSRGRKIESSRRDVNNGQGGKSGDGKSSGSVSILKAELIELLTDEMWDMNKRKSKITYKF